MFKSLRKESTVQDWRDVNSSKTKWNLEVQDEEELGTLKMK